MNTCVGVEFQARKAYSVHNAMLSVRNVQLNSKRKGGVGFIVAYGRNGDVAEERVCETGGGGLVQLQGDFGFRQSNIRMKREGRVIVVTRRCSTLVVDEFVNRLLHDTLKR